MRGAITLVLASSLVFSGGMLAHSQRLPWSAVNPTVADALYALRQTDHWLADLMSENFDGNAIGREQDERRPMNFDPTRHLSYIVTDLNRDGRNEAFLLIEWTLANGNGPAVGVLMQEAGDGLTRRWRIACEFDDRGRPGAIMLLDPRTHGWRHFRLGSGTYGWKRSAEGDGAMDCVPLIETPLR